MKRLLKLKKKKKTQTINCLKATLLIIKAKVTCTKNYMIQKVKKNEDQVQAIKEVFNKMRKKKENVSENNTFVVEENEEIINIVDNVLYFNQLEQQGSGLKILTPNQMLSKLPITLAQ